jgi:hypothetical protein
MSGDNKNVSLSEFKLSYIIAIVIIVVVNVIFFGRGFGKESAVKVNTIGDTLMIEYAKSGESYSIEGIENGQLTYTGGKHVFFHPDYKVSDNGDVYNILNSKGKHVGNVMLQKKSQMDMRALEIDLAEYQDELLKITSEHDYVRIYTSTPDVEHKLSIYVDDRNENLDLILDNVQIKAPDLSPALYSFSQSDINLTVLGNVTVKGGDNPFTVESISTIENLKETVGAAAHAYHYCLSSAKKTAMSIVLGIDYYAQMFAGVMAQQLETVKEAWDKVETFIGGKDGATGLDGVAGIIITGDFNLVTNESTVFNVYGGNGGKGGDGTWALVELKNGGDGGNGGSAMVCENLATYNAGQINLFSGEGGEGGKAGYTALESGNDGRKGGSYEARVVRGLDVIVKDNSN